MEKSEIQSLVAALEGAAIIAAAVKTDVGPGGLHTVIANDLIDHQIERYKPMTPFILEMKVQVDRWDMVVEKWFVNFTIKPFVLHGLKSHINESYHNGQIEYSLWGADVIFTPDIQQDRILATASKSYPDLRHACLGRLDLSGVQRLIDLKAFW
jgi:hypothetical protein